MIDRIRDIVPLVYRYTEPYCTMCPLYPLTSALLLKIILIYLEILDYKTHVSISYGAVPFSIKVYRFSIKVYRNPAYP